MPRLEALRPKTNLIEIGGKALRRVADNNPIDFGKDWQTIVNNVRDHIWLGAAAIAVPLAIWLAVKGWSAITRTGYDRDNTLRGLGHDPYTYGQKDRDAQGRQRKRRR